MEREFRLHGHQDKKGDLPKGKEGAYHALSAPSAAALPVRLTVLVWLAGATLITETDLWVSLAPG